MAKGAKDFLNIPDIDLPLGAPVVGYKLFYRSAQSPEVLQRIVQGTSIMNADSVVSTQQDIDEKSWVKEELERGELQPVPGREGMFANRAYVYDEEKPNVTGTSIKPDVGFFYWPDRALAEEYATWYSEEYANRDFYGIPTDKLKGRYELHRVEGIHMPKPPEDPFGQGMNEGMTMDEMMIDKEVLAAWSMTGERIDEKQSMADWVKQERKRVDEWNASHRSSYSDWY